MEQQTPILTLQLNVDQINAVLGALGKLPTETGVWPLMRLINDQATSQLQSMQQETQQNSTESNKE